MGGILCCLNLHFTDLLCDEWSAKNTKELAHKIHVYSIYSVKAEKKIRSPEWALESQQITKTAAKRGSSARVQIIKIPSNVCSCRLVGWEWSWRAEGCMWTGTQAENGQGWCDWPSVLKPGRSCHSRWLYRKKRSVMHLWARDGEKSAFCAAFWGWSPPVCRGMRHIYILDFCWC